MALSKPAPERETRLFGLTRKITAKIKAKKIRRGLAIGVMCFIALFYLAPLLWLFDTSFRPKVEIFNVPPRILQGPPWETFRSYSLESFKVAIGRYQMHQDFSTPFWSQPAPSSDFARLFPCGLCLCPLKISRTGRHFLLHPGHNDAAHNHHAGPVIQSDAKLRPVQ